jgi:transcriptional regulator with XRE-family HTH domain
VPVADDLANPSNVSKGDGWVVVGEDFDKLVGSNVQRFRLARGMSQADLAEAMTESGERVHQQTVLKIEKGTRPLKYAEAACLSNVLRVPMSAFLERPERAQAEANFVGLTYRLMNLEKDLAEFTAHLASVLIRLATEIAVNNARIPADQAPEATVMIAEAWLKAPWGKRFTSNLETSMMLSEIVSSNLRALDTTDYETILAGVAGMEVEKITADRESRVWQPRP